MLVKSRNSADACEVKKLFRAHAHTHEHVEMQMDEALTEVIQFIGDGATALFASSYLADELADEYDTECAGERVIATELLIKEKNALGSDRCWFESRKLVDLFEKGRIRDLISVFDAMDNLDTGIMECYKESGGYTESLLWSEFLKWKTDTSHAIRLSLFMTMLQMVIRVKVYAIRFRSRVHSPGGALYGATMKRLRKH